MWIWVLSKRSNNHCRVCAVTAHDLDVEASRAVTNPDSCKIRQLHAFQVQGRSHLSISQGDYTDPQRMAT
jgi:hypothetical protein